ncbi:hypothetical protein S101468_01340 [Acetobacter pasteurianus subsp. pasteurianus]|uniref:Uncharacterized protein n=1 Tax=Acetobacter pasteurianus subsp. pasteurianus TaxID=481145 RepID=A0AAC9SS97_ACEPA|nr:hypothetical protein S101468_01340 [Acetobacter pasteurianus subsp. pasteurianus]
MLGGGIQNLLLYSVCLLFMDAVHVGVKILRLTITAIQKSFIGLPMKCRPS